MIRKLRLCFLASLFCLPWLASPPLMADSVLKTVRVGIHPVTVAVNTETSSVYVGNAGRRGNDRSRSLSVITGISNSVSATVPMDSVPVDLAVSQVTNRIYIADQDGIVMVIEGNPLP